MATKKLYKTFLFLPFCLCLLDEKSFESLSELDRGFFTDQSLLSTSGSSLAVGSPLSFQATPSQRAPLLPPLCVFQSPESVDVDYLCVSPLQGMFSTPEVFLQKHHKAPGFEQVFREQDARHMSWDVSSIKLEDNSPKVCVEPGVLKQMWSPQLQPSVLAKDLQDGSD